MSRSIRNSLLLFIVAVLMVGFSLTVLAAEEGGDGGGSAGSTTTTIDSGLSPAIPMVVEEGEAPDVDWTYRYMIPTGLVLAGIIVLVTSIKYFTDVVRKRYRIVEE